MIRVWCFMMRVSWYCDTNILIYMQASLLYPATRREMVLPPLIWQTADGLSAPLGPLPLFLFVSIIQMLFRSWEVSESSVAMCVSCSCCSSCFHCFIIHCFIRALHVAANSIMFPNVKLLTITAVRSAKNVWERSGYRYYSISLAPILICPMVHVTVDIIAFWVHESSQDSTALFHLQLLTRVHHAQFYSVHLWENSLGHPKADFPARNNVAVTWHG